MLHSYDEDCELLFCKVCGLFEGSLTTDCCGEPVSYITGDKIYDGELDYREKEGWVKKINPTNQCWVYGRIFDMVRKKETAAKHKNEIMIEFGIDKEQYKEIEKRLIKDMCG